jgi:hypothetical protein
MPEAQDAIQNIYESFTSAMEQYSQALVVLDNANIELKAAEKRLQDVLAKFADFMGEYSPDVVGAGDKNFDLGLGLLNKITSSNSIESLFDAIKLF